MAGPPTNCPIGPEKSPPSPAARECLPITAFMGLEPTPPVLTFIYTSKFAPVTLSKVQPERTLKVQELIKARDELNPLVQSTLADQRERSRATDSKGKIPNFTKGYFVLVARDEYGESDKLLLRWRGPPRVVKDLNDYLYQVEDLRTGYLDDIHATRLKVYRD